MQTDTRETLPLCRLDEIPEPGSKGIRIGDQACFLVRQRGQVSLFRNRCPHLGLELNWQDDVFLDFDEQFVQCATHGALFLTESGECVSGPCLGQRLEQFPCHVENGIVYAVDEIPPRRVPDSE